MGRTAQDITDKELAVLQVIWDHGPSTIRRITDVLYPDGRSSYYATVQKLLERLEAKGYVTRDRSESVHVFAAGVARDDVVGQRLKAVADQLCDGSWTPLLTHLVQHRKLSGADRDALRRMIEELDRSGTEKKRRGKETK
jgi:BlaI family transcriptional regulator, penicillinase repressor